MGKTDWSAGVAWMRGEIMPIGQAAIPVTDWGLTHSDITYDVVHVWDGKFFRIDDYLERFEESLRKCRLSVPQSRDDMKDVLHAIVARSGFRESYVSVVASRGQPRTAGSRDPRDCENHFYAWCVPFVWVFPQDVMARGVRLYVPDDVHRIASDSVDPTAKNYHWGDFTQGLITAKETGFDNTLLLDVDGLVTEGPGFNVFMVKDGAVRTPCKGVLGGITRKVAMEIAVSHGMQVEETDIPLAEYLEADELFATTTSGGIVAITQVGERVFSNGVIGEATKRMQQTYWDWHDDSKMSEPVRYE
ncbi:branched-chain amino acid--2-keto-4-methylthiobutyrate aminotransferase [Ahrensia sp. R2A130]|uniref:branched-chain amino acid--2-keto-4-methylthiobutyrate aminotransferase n=1 Tax=Ahrensia sp. R2A130 TaxID=744979 RepID=UPI0001E0B4D0|nr:branched-chain amino acid--2-keto-4-methylthiobutyrate aminotransferase [Ahrensia sp. R2A130]EFL88714.1 branched chain amino acid: 2-keto-4-methylthiobutyrate aminotransferase [Ahrensia sp. R2A130]